MFDPRGPLQREGHFADEMTKLTALREGLAMAARLGAEEYLELERVVNEIAEAVAAAERSLISHLATGATIDPDRLSANATLLHEVHACLAAISRYRKCIR